MPDSTKNPQEPNFPKPDTAKDLHKEAPDHQEGNTKGPLNNPVHPEQHPHQHQ